MICHHFPKRSSSVQWILNSLISAWSSLADTSTHFFQRTRWRVTSWYWHTSRTIKQTRILNWKLQRWRSKSWKRFSKKKLSRVNSRQKTAAPPVMIQPVVPGNHQLEAMTMDNSLKMVMGCFRVIWPVAITCKYLAMSATPCKIMWLHRRLDKIVSVKSNWRLNNLFFYLFLWIHGEFALLASYDGREIDNPPTSFYWPQNNTTIISNIIIF